ncbi:ADP-heptose:LPS heptosyltransferase [Paraburkholderia sp. GAS33]|jgi:ADP-heptose:LPS heptosyltransferase|uniref:glycosyltransferase family 9 protein n=1 Tax=Paraburkholderia sp. GAS33 TaxID=3035130 RepID=UPI003D2327D7
MKAKLEGAASIAVAMPTAIGDALLMMVLVNNLIRNGYRLTVFSWVIADLADWFPGVDVRHEREASGKFDLVIQLRATPLGASLAADGEVCEIVRCEAFQALRHMIDMIVAVARDNFGLADVTRHNGIAVPNWIRFRIHERRVAIHPTGSHVEKMWPRNKFLALVRKLVQRDFQPTFLVAPCERHTWLMDHEAAPRLQSFDSLGDVAAWIAESGWFIGNDSGLGHLASALGVPTLSLFMRRGIARTWRPNWGHGAIVLPYNLLLGGALKERYWKAALTDGRVLRSFDRLRLEVDPR